MSDDVVKTFILKVSKEFTLDDLDEVPGILSIHNISKVPADKLGIWLEELERRDAWSKQQGLPGA